MGDSEKQTFQLPIWNFMPRQTYMSERSPNKETFAILAGKRSNDGRSYIKAQLSERSLNATYEHSA